MQTQFSLSFGKSFTKIRSAVLENGCLVFLWRTEKKTEKKTKKTAVKHICIRLIGGCVNKLYFRQAGKMCAVVFDAFSAQQLSWRNHHIHANIATEQKNLLCVLLVREKKRVQRPAGRRNNG